MTTQLLVRLPEELARRLKQHIPARRRSAFVGQLIEQALPPEEEDDNDPLYLAALEVERNEELAVEMAEWDVTTGDGLTDEAADPTPRG